MNEWRGYRWEPASKQVDGVRIWVPAGLATAPHDSTVISRMATAGARFMERIRDVYPAAREAEVPIALFPDSTFHKLVGLDPDKMSWVSVCVRDSAVCATQAWLTRTQVDDYSPEEQREIIHELMHVLLYKSLRRPSAPHYSLPEIVLEALPEAVPRFLLDLQWEMPESSRGLRSLAPAQLMTASEIESEGYFARSTNTPSENIAYISALAFLAGVAHITGSSIELTTRNLLSLGDQPDVRSYCEALAKRLDLSYTDVWATTLVQQEGVRWMNWRLPVETEDAVRTHAYVQKLKAALPAEDRYPTVPDDSLWKPPIPLANFGFTPYGLGPDRRF